MSLSPSYLATLAALLTVGCLSDLEARHVPNAVSAGLLLGGLYAQLTGAGAFGAAMGLCAALAALAILWWPWTRGWLGGGDVKAAIGVAAWLGLEGLPRFLVTAAIAGGVLSLVWLVAMPAAARSSLWRNLKGIVVLRELPVVDVQPTAAAVPYCLAVAAGAFTTIVGVGPG